MKNARSLALVLAALAAPLFPQESRADAEVSFEYFEEALTPFGEWISVADYGLCWRPTGVSEDWAPYTDGYWAYTDAGWTWVSYEDWGGITYHYGRWIHLVDDGWVWVPDYVWGPAWVSWRSSDEYVGWAPLPPEARWEESAGFSTWVDTNYDIGPDSYRFCRTRDFGAPVLAPVCVPYEENVVIIQNTVNITNISYNRFNSVVFCGGPNFGSINRHLRRPIPSLKLVCEDRVVRGNHGHRVPQVVRGNQLSIYAPKVKRPVDLKALPVKPQRVVGAEKINRGWSRVPDVARQKEIRDRFQRQSEGVAPRTAPARPVRTADLSGVPKKAEPNGPTPNVVVRDRNAPPRNPARPPISPTPDRPPQPVVEQRPVLPRVSGAGNPPPVAERVRPSQDRPGNVARPMQPPPANNQPPPVAERVRPPQVAVPEESSRVAEAERNRVQRQQQEATQHANELRNRQVQQQNEQRATEERRQRQQAEVANQQQEARRQQMHQQRQQEVARQQQENANRAAAREQQQTAQRAIELRRQQQVQQQPSVNRTQPAQHAEAMRQRQEAVQRSNAMRQQQQQQRQQPPVRQAEPPRRQEIVQPSRPAPPPPQRQQPSRSSSKDGEDDARKGRSR